MAVIGQKNFSVNINEKLSDEFTEQVDIRGYTKYRALEGAVRLWLTLSPHEQVSWIEGKVRPVFSDDPSENAILVDLDHLARGLSAVTEKIARAEAPKRKIKKKKHCEV